MIVAEEPAQPRTAMDVTVRRSIPSRCHSKMSLGLLACQSRGFEARKHVARSRGSLHFDLTRLSMALTPRGMVSGGREARRQLALKRLREGGWNLGGAPYPSRDELHDRTR
jgi:hypothetical protein